jgi:hypothetical protein
MNDGAEFIRGFPKWPETLVAQRYSVDVAENHGAAKLKLLHGAPQFSDRSRRIAKRQSSQRNEQSTLVGNDAGKSVIHKLGKPDRCRSAFYVRAGRGKRDDLSINAGLLQHLLAVFNVTMAGHSDVVIARVMQAGISGRVARNADRARSLFNGFDVFRWIEMIMKVERWHSYLGSSDPELAKGRNPYRNQDLSVSHLSLNLFYYGSRRDLVPNYSVVALLIVLRGAQKKYTGSPSRSKPSPIKLSRGAAQIWFKAIAADVRKETAGTSGKAHERNLGA